ncbi:MAG TPA: polyprenyl synthetase family protein [Microthrixaceae bacterium]|nr:polyprenyl synthetase family protein [Microthrixaceae bacterium]
MADQNPLQVMPSMAGDLARVEAELIDSVRSGDDFLTEISSHLIAAGGKRVRPGFCIAAAATALTVDAPAGAAAVTGGVAVELVHLGSLYHDDVMDEAEMRRTVDSVNARWGNLKAILAGDFLLARASELAAGLGVEVAGLLAATIGRLCEGQILELRHAHDLGRTEASYLRAIDGKTASLLASACRIGGIVAELPRAHTDALTEFGLSYGMAFQLVDDVLDLVATEAVLGKPAGHDLEEGVYTLPVIHTLASPAGTELAALLGTSLLADRSDAALLDPDDRDRAIQIVRDGDGIDRTIAAARAFADRGRAALAQLPDSPGVTGLSAAADYLLDNVEAAAA